MGSAGIAVAVFLFKALAFVVDLLIAVYLLFKRLFGLCGGGAAERAEREREAGWPALERTAPPPEEWPVSRRAEAGA